MKNSFVISEIIQFKVNLKYIAVKCVTLTFPVQTCINHLDSINEQYQDAEPLLELFLYLFSINEITSITFAWFVYPRSVYPTTRNKTTDL